MPHIFCARYCKYYKPGKEDMSCMAYSQISRLGLADIRIELRHKDAHVAYGKIMDDLRQSLCLRCDFYEDGCDFIASEGNIAPCGGLLVLADMISSGRIKYDDVK